MAVNEKLIDMKRAIVAAATAAGEGHIASAFSVLDLLWVLYDRVLGLEPIKSKDPRRDVFILSKGHASLALYAVLAEKGFFPKTALASFCQVDSMLGGHPDCRKVPGVEASTGSLGHGLPMAVGVALGYRAQGFDNRVFALIGDGESNEGSIWESALLAAHHRLNRLTCIVDVNHSTDRALGLGSLIEKFTAFGWRSLAIDGHDHDQILKALLSCEAERPVAVIAETTKGHGCRRMEGNPEWHHKAPTPSELPSILEELS